jgi:deoxyribodipyrimidine photolyase-related protein
MRNKIFVVLGNHLFNPDFFSQYKDDHIFYMAEDLGLCTYEKHHKHKILLFLSSMRSFCDELKEKKFEVIYKRIEDNDFELDYLEKLKIIITEKKIETISVFEIEDKPFEQTFLSDLKDIVSVNYLSSPMFLTKRKDFKEYNDSVKKPFMANFYKKQRKENNFLIEEDGSPSGGKWSFDEENRKKIPKEIKLPSQLKFKFTTHTKHLIKIIDDRFKDHIGQLDDFWLCTTRTDAWIIFSHFLDEKINLFGDYEDAVDQRDNVLFHSTLSPLMNLGLITPSEILEKLKKIKDEIKINSIEGYFRQIVGWREFIRGVYQNYDKKFETSNFFNHNRLMKKSWYEGSTGLLPLDHSIKNANKYAWTHHIERLMIQANIMNLCEINPKRVYIWFMEHYVDSSEWVMYPNVYGMGLFSDGGVFSTKPYICGSAYFRKMMDFKKGEWCDILDGLYWRFIEKNKDFFLKNPRLSMMVRVLNKMNLERRKKIIDLANKFIEDNTTLSL